MHTTQPFHQEVHNTIERRHLLAHPFYVAWTEGRLSQAQLRGYAEQYFHHVLAEPTYLSAVHANTPSVSIDGRYGDVSVRQRILENLIGEEMGEDNHPALWKRFALALGATERDVVDSTPLDTTTQLIDTFTALCRERPFFIGLAALHAFESQVPQIAAVKIDGLQRFYGMQDPAAYAFFSVHQEADVHHSRTEWALIEKFADTPDKRAAVIEATREACEALWQFLDGVYETYCAPQTVN